LEVAPVTWGTDGRHGVLRGLPRVQGRAVQLLPPSATMRKWAAETVWKGAVGALESVETVWKAGNGLESWNSLERRSGGRI